MAWARFGAVPVGGAVSQHGLDDEVTTESIAGRFARQAESAETAVALVCDSKTLTYGELDRRSNQLARYLHLQGIGPGHLVALRPNRSFASIEAILAILKCGAAYAPLDPAAPADRLGWMLRDCGADLLLADAACPTGLSCPVLAIDKAMTDAAALSPEPLEISVDPDAPAYVMYTSGSTGNPKGVQVPQRAVLRLVTDQNYARFAADEVFLHAAPLAFDASTFEIWGALLHGARLIVLDEEGASLQRIAETIRQHHVTTAWFTAGLFHLLVEHRLPDLAGLRQILAGGDVLSPTHVRRALAALPNCQLINGYGPTENTTFTCCYRIPREGWGNGPVPIGTPIHGTYVRLLDEMLEPVAAGDVGMLYAGGAGLATGYIGAARRSSDSFIPDPFRPGAMLYRTGDLARLRPDGSFDFLGRRDRQVKVDGKRIELTEIEEAMRGIPDVADAAVTLSRDGGDLPSLTGYVKAKPSVGNRNALRIAVRTALARTLPAWMQPSQLVVLDEFPLNANGKVDHARLAVQRPAAAPRPPAAAPLNDTEKVLSGILARVLGLRDIGPDTNFFELGATSLKLVEVHAELERVRPGTPLLMLFRHPTLRGLAGAIDGSKASVASDGMDARARAQRQASALRRLLTRNASA